MGLNIESVKAEKIENDHVLDTFVLTSEEEDYYLYERLAERMRFALSELQEIRLLSIQ
jgi:hypothetical protein